MMVAIHQYRMLRMAMILMIVALTIFLYAFYYTNPAITTPVHSSSAAALQSTAYIGIGEAVDISGATSNKSITGHQQGSLAGKLFYSFEFDRGRILILINFPADANNGSYEQADLLSSASSSIKPNELIRSDSASDQSKKPDQHGKILMKIIISSPDAN